MATFPRPVGAKKERAPSPLFSKCTLSLFAEARLFDRSEPARFNDSQQLGDFIMSDACADVIVARCGLVCSNCGAFKTGRCKGCHSEKPMFGSCPVRACTIENQWTTCADCTRHVDLKQCKKLNSFVARLFGLIFRSDRIGGLNRIRDIGLDEFKCERRSSGTK